MRNALAILGMIVISASVSFGQAAAGKPATQRQASDSCTRPQQRRLKPTAIIDTTAGKMTCTLFPDKAPIGVANFIGLATGTKDWKNPVSGATKHGVPLYDGTDFSPCDPAIHDPGRRSGRHGIGGRPSCAVQERSLA